MFANRLGKFTVKILSFAPADDFCRLLLCKRTFIGCPTDCDETNCADASNSRHDSRLSSFCQHVSNDCHLGTHSLTDTIESGRHGELVTNFRQSADRFPVFFSRCVLAGKETQNVEAHMLRLRIGTDPYRMSFRQCKTCLQPTTSDDRRADSS